MTARGLLADLLAAAGLLVVSFGVVRSGRTGTVPAAVGAQVAEDVVPHREMPEPIEEVVR